MKTTDAFINFKETPLYEEIKDTYFNQTVSAPKYISEFNEKGFATVEFDTRKYPFRRITAEMIKRCGYDESVDFIDANLERLHEFTDDDSQIMDGSQQNRISSSLFEQPPSFKEAYKRFNQEFVKTLLNTDERFHYQNTCTYLIFFPGMKGYPGPDSWHSDNFIGHPLQEINFYVPLTEGDEHYSFSLVNHKKSNEILQRYDTDFAALGRDLQDNKDLQKEIEEAREVLEVKYGQLLIFDARILHGGIKTRAQTTRVSFNFRILMESDAQLIGDRYRGTGRRKTCFKPGVYYSEELV